MDQETQRHIFEPFYTTKPVGKGTGFGLSTCYGIIKQAGGYIWVDSEPGIGTTLEIYLPRVHQDVQERASPRVVADHRGTEAVLVAEDDDQVRKLIARTLTQLGYRVFEAANGREASRWFEQSTRSIDLLLTDVVMPEMSGKDLVDSISGRRPGMKVLYMSGYTPDAIVHQGVLEPGTHLLQKPFTPSALASKVREMLDE
jgi:CheY-like chemotaxis protein